MKKIYLKVPNYVEYISQWGNYELPKGRCIIDKGVTGCGYTEYCITNEVPVILCSPRKILLENKMEQHKKKGHLNVLYLENNIENSDGILDYYKKIYDHWNLCLELKLPPKFLITYDSTHYIVDCFKKYGIDQSQFYFVIDEFQSIFLDAFYKADSEFNFVESIKDCSNVIYLSATPMLDRYLQKVDEFSDLPYHTLDWSETSVVETIKLKRELYTSLSGKCTDIINLYRNRRYPVARIGGKTVYSTEAVIYMNDITDIIRTIKKAGLTPNEVNIICAKSRENQSRLDRLSKSLGYRRGNGFKIGHIPLEGEPNKMFTFCTKTVYVGADFYSDCASTYIFADPNIKCLALDISLDLPQIVGRQRNKNNPFKNNVTLFYKVTRMSELYSRELFDHIQEERRLKTYRLLNLYDKADKLEKRDYVEKLRDSIGYVKYERDFVSISRKLGSPVYNNFIELANERAWEVSQKDYQDSITVTQALKDQGFKIFDADDKYNEILIADFFEGFNKLTTYKDRFKYYCNFRDSSGNSDTQFLIDDLIEETSFKVFYEELGSKECKVAKWNEKELRKRLKNRELLDTDELKAKIYSTFDIDSYSLKYIKQTLQDIYTSLGILKKAKASDLSSYFHIVPTKTKNLEDPTKWENAYRLEELPHL